MYGPNTNIVVNGSIIYFSECEAHYITESIRLLLESGRSSMDCRPEVHDAYNETVDATNRQMAWGHSKVSSWYKNASGRVAQNWPFPLLEFWKRTRHPDPADYTLR
jgi:4-hydroxyacetophenone monooxygenase